MKLQIQYGSDIYEIFLSNKNNKIQVEDILDEIEKRLKVSKCHQSLIYKGQRLDKEPNAYLDDFCIFNNSKLILSGTQKQIHDKYCCPDHDHNIMSEKQDKSNSSVTKLIVPKKQEIQTNPIGFIPEPNKTYE